MSLPELADIFVTNGSGLAIVGEVDRDDWEAFGRDLGDAGRRYQWVVGDWLLHGEKNYGSTYESAMEVTGLELEVLRRCKQVSRRFEKGTRVPISWSHHREVQALTDDQAQEVLEWAVEENASVVATRKKKKEVVNTPRPGAPGVVNGVSEAIQEAFGDNEWRTLNQMVEELGGAYAKASVKNSLDRIHQGTLSGATVSIEKRPYKNTAQWRMKAIRGSKRSTYTTIQVHMVLDAIKALAKDGVSVTKRHAAKYSPEYAFDDFKEILAIIERAEHYSDGGKQLQVAKPKKASA